MIYPSIRWLASGTAVSLLALSTPALAAGTTAGTVVTNQVTVDFQVSGVQQTSQTASTSFTVDRKVNLTVVATASSATTVAPKQQKAVTAFRLTNLSNDVLDFALTASQLSGSAAARTGTDNFDVTSVAIYRDTNNNTSFDSASDQVVTYIDELAADADVLLFVAADVPDGRATGDIATVRLRATAGAGGTSGSQGSALSATSGANTNGVDTVLADGAGSGDSAYDGIFGAIEDFRVVTAALTITKTTRIVSDPVNNTTDPKNIPGALVEYCIQVANAAGGTSATGLSLSDPLPSEMTFVNGSILLDGTVSSGTCQADGTSGGSYSGGNVTGTLSTLAAGATRTLVYRATIN